MATGQAAEQAGTPGNQRSRDDSNDRGPGSVAGNLGHDPELRFTQAGKSVTNLRVAESQRVRDSKTGEWGDGPIVWYEIQLWGLLAENVCEYLERGDRIVAQGRWTSQQWTDNEGAVQEKVVLTARDLGPSLLFRGARIERPAASRQRARGGRHQAAKRGHAAGPAGGD
jgi:single-strand DNA-binding protein